MSSGELEADWTESRLDPADEAAFEAELAVPGVMRELVSACRESDETQPEAPSGLVRQQILDLAHAPQLPIDLESIAWQDAAPGLKLHVVHEDAVRGVRGCLVWAQGGFRNVRHRHLGDEVILVLDGELRDTRGCYTSGQICHSRTGSEHFEEIPPGQDCLAYVVYYGELEPLE